MISDLGLGQRTGLLVWSLAPSRAFQPAGAGGWGQFRAVEGPLSSPAACHGFGGVVPLPREGFPGCGVQFDFSM